MNAGSYKAKIMDWGVKEYTQTGETKLFVKFEILDAQTSQDSHVTWNGSLDSTPKIGRNGKEYTMLDITKSNLKTLGFRYGDDLEAIVTQPNPFNMDEVFELDIQSFQTKEGRTGTYVRSFDSVSRPKEKGSSNVKVMEKDRAQSFLKGLSKKIDLPVAPKVVNAATYEEVPF